MASQPLVAIQYPQNAFGTGLVTPGPASPTDLTQAATTSIGHIIGDGSGLPTNARLTPIPSSMNTCYRDAVLVGLLSTPAFLGYLRHCADPNFGNNVDPQLNPNLVTLAAHLHGLSQTLWNSSLAAQPKRQQLRKHVNQFWHFWQTQVTMNADDDQEDAVGFLLAMIQELRLVDPGQSLGPEVFKYLFECEFVGRLANECSCTTKQRQPFRPDDSKLVLPTVVNEHQSTIEDAMAWAIYDVHGDRQQLCPSCGQMSNLHRYVKFRYLPELLLVQVDFTGTDGHGQAINDAGRRCILPSIIDLGALRDKVHPNAQHDETQDANDPMHTDSLYQLKFVVDYNGGVNATTSAGHYRCNVRRSGNQWETVDGLGVRGRVTRRNLDQIEKDAKFQPRILAYERFHVGGGGKINDGDGTGTGTGTGNGVHIDDKPVDNYHTWTLPRLRQEMTTRGIALPAHRRQADHVQVLQQHDQNPKNYTMYTVAKLHQMIADKGLQYLGRAKPNKSDLVQFLTANDQPKIKTDQPDTNPPQPPLPKPATLQDNVDKLTKANLGLQQQVQDLQAKLAQATATVNPPPASGLQTQYDNLLQAKQGLEHQLTELRAQQSSTNSTAANDLQRANVSLLAQLNNPAALLLSVRIQEINADAIVSGIYQQHLILLHGFDPQTWNDPNVHSQLVSGQDDSNSSHLRVTVAIGPYRADAQDVGSRIETIKVHIPNNIDTNAVHFACETEVLRITAPLLMQSTQTTTSTGNANPNVAARANLKRPATEASEQDGGWAAQGSPKRQR